MIRNPLRVGPEGFPAFIKDKYGQNVQINPRALRKFTPELIIKIRRNYKNGTKSCDLCGLSAKSLYKLMCLRCYVWTTAIVPKVD